MQMTERQLNSAKCCSRWRRRVRQYLREHPLCVMCEAEGITHEATVVDHVVPHRGDYHRYWFGAVQGLCDTHHNSHKKQLEKRGFVRDIGPSGWPLDPNHEVYRAERKA